MAKTLRPKWDDGKFAPRSMCIRHATHGDVTYGIRKPARFMFYEDRGQPRLAVEVETDAPSAKHPLAALGSASIWIRGIRLPAKGRDGLTERVIKCNDWLERGGRTVEYVVFNLGDTIETRDTAVRFLDGGSRIQIVTLADDVDAYDEDARPNPVYVDAPMAARPTQLPHRIGD